MRDIFNTAAVEIPVLEVSSLHFPSEDVLFSEEERKERAQLLFLQTSGFGINEAELTFEDLTGLKTTVGKLMNVTEDCVYLEHDVKIPVNRILNFRIKNKVPTKHELR